MAVKLSDIIAGVVANLKRIQFRRGDTASVPNELNEGELYVDMQAKKLYVGSDPEKFAVGVAELEEAVTTNVTVGGVEAQTELEQGLTLTDYVKKVHVKVFNPTYIAPTLQLNTNTTGEREIGSEISITLSAVFNRGSILGDLVGDIWYPNVEQNPRAGAATEYTIHGVTQEGNVRTFTHEVVANTNSFQATVEYAEGEQPMNSVGEPFETPLAAGSLSMSSNLLEGRYKQFYGAGSNHPTDSSGVRGLASNNFSSQNSFSIMLDQTHFTIAIPSTKTLVSVVTQNNETITGGFTLETFNVNDAGGNPISYKVYKFVSAIPLGVTASVQLS